MHSAISQEKQITNPLTLTIMRPYTIENIIADEIMSRYNACNLELSGFFVEIELSDYLIEVSGSIDIQGHDDGDYYSSVGGFVITRVDVDIESCDVYDEEGRVDMRIDRAKIERILEQAIKD